jgi:hypothetical protein
LAVLASGAEFRPSLLERVITVRYFSVSMRHFVRNSAMWLALPGFLLGSAFLSQARAGAVPSGCGVVSIAVVDAKLGIDAAHVAARRPSASALACSYYGNSGRAANEATINYLPASARTFFAVEALLGKTHAISKVAGIKSGAYTYVASSDRFLYVLDGTTQVQIFVIDSVPLGRLKALGRALPLFP